jgi:hypothetical protein
VKIEPKVKIIEDEIEEPWTELLPRDFLKFVSNIMPDALPMSGKRKGLAVKGAARLQKVIVIQEIFLEKQL